MSQDNGTLTVGERLARIDEALDRMNGRLRQVELRMVYVSASIATVVSFGAIILSYVIK